MVDIILDTNVLADLLAQYYEDEVRYGGVFESKGFLNPELVRKLNKIIGWYTATDDGLYPGLVTASSFAFVEIARKFDEIAEDRFTLDQFAEFIDQPPEWFIVSAVDTNLFFYLCKLPGQVRTPNNKVLPIEWADAIHMATATSRDEPWLLAATDSRIQAAVALRGRII
jgi:hypothetical protein